MNDVLSPDSKMVQQLFMCVMKQIISGLSISSGSNYPFGNIELDLHTCQIISNCLLYCDQKWDCTIGNSNFKIRIYDFRNPQRIGS